MCLLAICTSSFEKCLLRFSAQFPSCGLFDINLCELFMCFGILIPSRSYLCRYFTPFSRLSFPVVGDSPCCAQAFAFKEVPFVYFCFIYLCLRDRSKKILLLFMSQNVRPMSSGGSFRVSDLTFRCLIHFEFIIVYVIDNVLISFFCK